MAVVEIRDLSKSYGPVRALEDVTLEICEGVSGLLGPNGAGKSTLLLCVLGLLPDWSGEVRVLGMDARHDRRALRRRIGFMPETDAYLPGMTGIGAVRHLGRLAGMPYSQALRRGHEVLWHVGLGEAVYRELREYSTGMRQRFKLAQALVHDPQILFLDEPLGGMDPAGRDELLALVRDLSDRQGKHVVWSSHILPEVQKVADAVVVLHQGRFQGSFRLEDLRTSGGRYVVELEGEVERFRELLAKANVDIEEAGDEGAAAAALYGRRTLTASLPKDRDTEDLFRLARLGGVRLRRLTPQTESLEQVFHQLLENEESSR